MEFRPITLLCGINSVGKSAIIKSILLTKQSSIVRRSLIATSVPSQPLILNGELTKLGAWSDTITNKEKDKSLTFCWSVNLTGNEYIETVGRAFDRRPRIKKQRKDKKVNLSIEFSSDKEKAEELSIRVDKWHLEIDSASLLVTRADGLCSDDKDCYRIRLDNPKEFLNRETAQIGRFRLYLGDALRSIKAESGSIELGNVSVNSVGPFISSIRPIFDDSWSNFFDSLYEIADRHRGVKRGPRPKWIEHLQSAAKNYRSAKRDGEREVSRSPVMRGLMFLIIELIEEVTRGFQEGKAVLAPMWRDIRYLGPLRDQPRRFYQFDDTGGADVGVSGEFTVQVLAIEQYREISATQVATLSESQLHYSKPQNGTLLEHTNHWLSHMNLPNVNPSSLQQSLYKLEVGDLGVALLDVGFGVSQVLPIIVEALRAERGDLVILEQPEIHLHPKVQAQLADFLLARSQDGVRFLVESHSEYLIKRMCRRMSEAEGSDINKLVSILFVHGDTGMTTCEPVCINEFGEITNWPKGFFDLDEDLYWTKAALQKRKRRKALDLS